MEASVTAAWPGQACAQELADDGRLPRFLEQEAVVAVRRVDHLEVDRLAEARSASAISADADGGYSQSELNAISSVRAVTPASARASDPPPYCRARSKYVSAREV